MKVLMNWVRMMQEHEARTKRSEIAEKNHYLAKVKFEYDAAREAILHSRMLREIDENPDLDDPEKIWEARAGLFVPPEWKPGMKPLAPLPPMMLPNGELYYGPRGRVAENKDEGGRLKDEGPIRTGAASTGGYGGNAKPTAGTGVQKDESSVAKPTEDGGGRLKDEGTVRAGNNGGTGLPQSTQGSQKVERNRAENGDLNAKSAKIAKQANVEVGMKAGNCLTTDGTDSHRLSEKERRGLTADNPGGSGLQRGNGNGSVRGSGPVSGPAPTPVPALAPRPAAASAPAQPVMKTAADWVREAKDYDAMMRYFMTERCNGSADRFDQFLKSPKLVTIPRGMLIELGEI